MTKNAFISVDNKDGVGQFARELKASGWKILASTGTAKFLRESMPEVQDFYEGVSCHAEREERAEQLAKRLRADIGLVYINFRSPWIKEAESGCQIGADIGGPLLVSYGIEAGRIVFCPNIDSQISQIVRPILLSGGEVPKGLLGKLHTAAQREVVRYAETVSAKRAEISKR